LKKNLKGAGVYLLIVILAIAAVSFIWDNAPKPREITYLDVIDHFYANEVKTFSLEGSTLKMTLYNGENVEYIVPYLSLFMEDIRPVLEKQRDEVITTPIVDYNIKAPRESPWWAAFVPYLVMFGLIIVLWYFMMRQAGGGNKAMSFGKARTRFQPDHQKRITFADVAGADEEKEELSEIVDFLKDPHKYAELGARIPKGVLLVGPPGTGKTYMARAVAGEAGVPFLSISGSDFVEMYVGVGASRVRDLFEQAKRHQPAIVFIDEIDAVGRQRGAGLGGGHDEREQTLNQLLVEMDGFVANEGVIIIAATNRPDILDTALLRPGRFDRQVYIGLPDTKAREAILKVHARGKVFEPNIDFSIIARGTVGFSPADLENLLNEAALLTARRGKRRIGMAEISEAELKVVVGPEKRSRSVSDKERKLTAYHEAGHAVVSYFLEHHPPVHQISIIPRGMAGGYTLSLPKEDKSYKSRSEMKDEIVSLLGGRVAEKIFLDDISTGASNDIQRATDLARKMVTKYGMSDSLGPIRFGSDHEEVFLGRDFSAAPNYSQEVAATIDREIKAMIQEAYERAEDLLRKHSDKVQYVTDYLLEHEKMEADVFRAVFEGDPSAKEEDSAKEDSSAEKDSSEASQEDKPE
jgi:cell division protease FtsH